MNQLLSCSGRYGSYFPLRDDAFQITAAYKLEQFLSPFFDVVAVKLSDMIHAQGNTIRPPAYGQRRELWLKLGGCLNVTVKRPECVSRLPTPPQFARLALHLL